MVKHTQAICWLLPTNCSSVFDHFAGLALKGLTAQGNNNFHICTISKAPDLLNV